MTKEGIFEIKSNLQSVNNFFQIHAHEGSEFEKSIKITQDPEGYTILEIQGGRYYIDEVSDPQTDDEHKPMKFRVATVHLAR